MMKRSISRRHLSRLILGYLNHRQNLIPFQPTAAIIHFFSTQQKPNRDELEADEQQGYTLSNSQIKAIRLLKNQYNDATEMKDTNPLAIFREQSMKQDLEHEQDKPAPWYNLLMHPSRALWRSSPQPPPKYIMDMQSNLIQRSGRKLKQLKRTYEIILNQQKALIQSRELERRQLVNGIRHLQKDSPHPSHLDVHPIYYKPEYTLSSLKFRLVPNYSITKRVLAETQSLIGIQEFQPKRILDVGCGVGSAAAAALEYFREGRGLDRGFQVQWIHAIDASQSMRDAAQYLLQDIIQQSKYNTISKTRVTFSDSLTSSAISSESQREGKGFDLALCAYTLSELPSVTSVLSMAAIIWEKLAVDGVAIFIEPGTPDGFNAIRSVRTMLLDCCPPSEGQMADTDSTSDSVMDECHVIAPCTHNGTCPMERHKKNFLDKKGEPFDVVDDGSEEDEFWEDSKMEEYGFQKRNEGSCIDAIEDDEKDDDIDSIDSEENDPILSSTAETDVFSSAFCSFVHGLPGGATRGEKFSYLVVQKRAPTMNKSQSMESDTSLDLFSSVSLVDLLRRSIQEGEKQYKLNGNIDGNLTAKTPWLMSLHEAIKLEDIFVQSNEDKLGLELVRGDRNRKKFGRIIRAPIKKRGHVILDYCSMRKDAIIGSGLTSDGRIIRHRISRGKSMQMAPGMFAAARKARWGGLWPDIRR